VSETIIRWAREYAEKQNFQPANVTALKAMNYLLAVQTAVVGLLLIGPADLFLQPSSPPDSAWLAPTLLGFDLWEILFFIGSFWLIATTVILKGVTFSHAFLGLVWLTFGVLWTVGGIIYSPSYLFGVGVLGVFIALQHVAMMGVWRAEGV